jgi:hypothetical protein
VESDLDRDIETKAALFLPDGQPTGIQDGDLVVWEKTTGLLRFQRPGVGTLRAPATDGKTLPCDEKSVREMESSLNVSLGWAMCFIGISILDETSDRAIFLFSPAS